MIPVRRRLIRHSAKVFDLLALTSSFILAGAVDSLPKGITLEGFLAMRIKLGNVLLFVLLMLVWHYIFTICGLYNSKRLTAKVAQVLEVCKATILATLFFVVVATVAHIRLVTIPFVSSFCILTTLIMVAGRLVARSLFVALRIRGRNRRFIIIVGTNRRAIEFADQIASHPELGYEIIGFVDNDWPGFTAFQATGYPHCSTFADLAQFLRSNVVDEAAIYLPLKSYYEHAAELVSLCQLHGIVIRLDVQVFPSQELPGRGNSEASPHIGSGDHQEVFAAITKRILDLVVSGVLLVVLSPLLAAVAILVRLTSPGPALFRQTRIGLNKRQFGIYKFRTMVMNAEKLQDQLLGLNEMTGPVFKIRQDPRITPLGRILRKTSIDELPQLLNVLKGEMSLVGPRALPLRDYELFDQDWQRRRFSVKPGITCTWQVCGRNAIPFEQWMEMDMQYIDKWSLWLDFTILIRTVPAVLRGSGAA